MKNQMTNQMTNQGCCCTAESPNPSSNAATIPGGDHPGHQPIFNVYPKGEAWEMEVMMPGVSKADVQMEISGNTLTVHGKKKANASSITKSSSSSNGCGCSGAEKTEKPWKALHQEIDGNDYHMQWELGRDIDLGKIEARMENGALHIHLPKLAAAQSKAITVK